MKSWLLGLVFVVCLAVFAVSMVPLSAVLGWSGVSAAGLRYQAAHGSVWNGQLEGASLRGIDLGTVETSLRAFDLVTGSLTLDWRLRDGEVEGKGTLSRGLGGTTTLRDADLAGRLDRMPLIMPVTGAFSWSVSRLSLSPRGCERADGTLTTSPRVRYSAEREWVSPPLEGALVCDDRALVLPLKGTRGSERLDLEARIAPDLGYNVTLSVATRDEAVQNGMALMGFEERAGTFTYAQAGALLP